MNDTVYLDNAATTPLHPAVLEAMLPYLRHAFGNPSATYRLARQANRAVEGARRTVARALGCRPSEVVFTSGGTESINTAIKGVAFAQKRARAGNHIVTTTIEHHAVLHSCQYLERFGFQVTYVPVDETGRVDPHAVLDAVTPQTILVSVMTANNEVGTIQPIAEIAAGLRQRAQSLRRRVPLHTDAVQAANALDLEAITSVVDLLSLAAHKFRGPKGSGVLYLRRGVPFLAQLDGGGQERQRRAGTENVAGIVGTAHALRLAQANRETYRETTGRLRHRLVTQVLGAIPGAAVNGHPEHRLPNIASISFPGADSRDVLAALDAAGIAASAGSACGEETLEPSHVLLAMGMPLEQAAGTLRFALGIQNTEADVDHLLAVLPPAVERSRASRRPVGVR